MNVNMMPIIMGDSASIPYHLKQWTPLIGECDFERGSTVYLTVNSGHVAKGQTLRRPGIHVEAPASFGWGGGWGGGRIECFGGGVPTFGGREGLYIWSTDGGTRIWDCQVEDRGPHGEVPEPGCKSFRCDPRKLYWMTDRTPHEALPAESSGPRTFFRLVSSNVTAWYARHNTANPLGVEPGCPITHADKFAN